MHLLAMNENEMPSLSSGFRTTFMCNEVLTMKGEAPYFSYVFVSSQ